MQLILTFIGKIRILLSLILRVCVNAAKYMKTQKYSVKRTLKAIKRSDVVLVLIDTETGIREQDKNIAGYAHDAGRAIVIVVNKWDTVEVNEKSMKEFENKIRTQFQFLDYAPI